MTAPDFKSETLAAFYSAMGVLPPDVTPTIGDSIAELLISKKQAGCRANYVQSLKDYLRLFAKGQEQRRIGEFTMADIERWFASRDEAPQSRNSNRGRLSALFNWAWRRGYLMHNPIMRTEAVRIVDESPEILTVDKCRKALIWTAENEKRFLAWLTLSLLVGLRPESEADTISWPEIQIERSIVRISGARTKTRRHRLIDLTMMPAAIEWLRLAKANDPEEETLPMVYMARRRYMKRLQSHLAMPEWPQDILRHTAASYLFAFHQDAGKVATFLGNSAGVLLKRYRALVDREDAVQWFDIRPPV